jgi:transcription-repair coupling factor (superfamily II helicase)
LQFLTRISQGLAEYRSLEDAVKTSVLPACATGLSNVHKAHVIYSLCERTGRTALVIAPDEMEGTRLTEDLTTFFGGGVYFYPARDFTLRPVEGTSHEYEHERLKVLGHMARGDYRVVVACPDAAMQLTMPKSIYLERSLELRRGEELPPDKAVRALVGAGYSRSPQVDGPGQFSLRGGILDFFPPDCDEPVRLEFWGDEIDSIGLFDPDTQRRTASLESALITPAVEVHFTSPQALGDRIRALLGRLGASDRAAAGIRGDLELIEAGSSPASLDRYLPLCYDSAQTVFEYAAGGMLFVSEEAKCAERIKNTLWQQGEDITALLEDGVLCSGLDRFYLEPHEVVSRYLSLGAVYLETFPRSSFETGVRMTCNFRAVNLPQWNGSVKELCEDLAPVLEAGGSAAVLAGTEKNCETVARQLGAEGVSAYCRTESGGPEAPPRPGYVYVLPGRLSAGFRYPEAGFMLISSGGAAPQAARRRARHKMGEHIRSLSELTVGDYVVHSAHGIGVYEGIHKLEVQGIVKDYIKIKYSGSDTLYVPVTQLDLVSKYIGSGEDGAVRLSKMGGAEWQKTKTRVRRAVQDMAKELIALYAERQRVKGIIFPSDDEMQRDFEERFEFDETDDQLRCASEIKSDMQRPFPMDRLLCGDVGFGKTEVALRAAFKCVCGGYQCALLVPTTILAWQHYQTMLRRMEGFPVKIELLSRFRTPKEQEAILRKLASGRIDIVVGTHRLVQKDVKFRRLGLVVIDEEQRFGVAQKERLKELFKTVDVLTLSATPIPRTLNMALSGIRDMSTIEEAPQDRHPVQTYVLEHDWGIVADAIKKEMRRGGQVYYLHNRVETIDLTAAKIASLVPEARIGVAHGKMDEEQLSRIWERLLGGEIDVLVCTTIIETGVDVPNVNTLIIEDADRMGLSQLHQIRGRVGRSPRRAFAYFTFKRGKALSDISTKRLRAIREYTEFGSGFQIALRDLEIRGAGNILGGQQHGHMESVGYDMYLRLLNDAVLEEKGEKPANAGECMVDVQVTAHLPENYIEDSKQRLEIYRRIADISNSEDAGDVIDELVDRFGDVPDAVKSLVDVALLRNTAASLGITEILQRGEVLLFYQGSMDLRAVSALVTRMRGRVMVNAGQKPYFSVKIPSSGEPLRVMREVLAILSEEREASPGGERA